MVVVPIQKADIPQAPDQHTEQQDSAIGSAVPAPSPQNRVPLGAHYYLTEGLEGVEAQCYRGTQSFMTAIRLQADQLRSGNAGQYAVFSQVQQDKLANIEQFRNTHYKSLRFLYYESEQILVVKIMPGEEHEVAVAHFEIALALKLTEMGVLKELRFLRSTVRQGICNRKEPDSSFRPRLARPSRADWSTLVIECGVSQSLKRLRAVCNWWFENSRGQVKTVLLFAINLKTRKIHIEQWEACATVNLPITGSHHDSDWTKPECISTIDIIEADAGSASLRLNFKKLFLREPGQGEMDILFTTEDLESLAADVWEDDATGQSGSHQLGSGQTILYHQVRSFCQLARQLRVESQDKPHSMVACHHTPYAIISCRTLPYPPIFHCFPLLSAVTHRPLPFPTVFRRPLQFPSVLRRPLPFPTVFRRPLPFSSVFRRPLRFPTVFRHPLPSPTVFCHPLPSPTVFRCLLLFSAVACLPFRPPAILQRHLLSPTQNSLKSWGLSSFLITSILAAHQQEQNTFCYPISSCTIDTPRTMSYRNLGPLPTICLAWFPIQVVLHPNTVSQPNPSLALSCSYLRLC